MLNSVNRLFKPNGRYQKPLAIVNLDIGDPIIIYPGDDIQNILQIFCQNNDLDNNCVEYLYQTIMAQIQQKEFKESNPPSFGLGGDFLADSFGNPSHLVQNIQNGGLQNNLSDFSQQNTNNSMSERTEQHLASNYEKWQQVLITNQKQKQINGIRKMPSAVLNNGHQELTKINFTKQHTSQKTFNKLYADGLEQYKMRDEIQKLNSQLRSEHEFNEATFKPRISLKSKILVQTRGRQNITQKKANIIHKPEEFTFKPQLSSNTLKIMANNMNRSKTPPIYQKLYTEGAHTDRTKQQWAIDIFNKQHPFSNLNSKSPKQNYKQQQEVVKRLTVDSKDRNMKKERLSDVNNDLSRQQLFQPRINKDQIYQQVSSKVDLQDQMLSDKQYIYSGQRLSLLNSNCQSTQTPKSQAQTPKSQVQTPFHTRNHTRNMSKNNEFETSTRKIFDLLDGDNDGLISATNLDLSQINGNVLELIADILYQMEDDGLIFDLQKFRDICIVNGLNEQLIGVINLLKLSGQFNTIN